MLRGIKLDMRNLDCAAFDPANSGGSGNCPCRAVRDYLALVPGARGGADLTQSVAAPGHNNRAGWENNMPFIQGVRRAFWAFTASVFVLSLPLVLSLDAARAQEKTQDKTYVMKITLPTINEAQHQFAKNYAAAVEQDSGGRIKAEIFPASQLGSIPRQIEGLQFGAIQCGVIPPEFFVGIDERFEVMAAPGLVDSMAHGLRLTADPAVLKLMLGLGAGKGLHGVGMFMTQMSSIVSRTPIRHLADFKGKKIRVFASQFQTAAFERLGATPVAMSLGDVLPAIQQGAIDGSLAGLTIYTNMHYQDAAKYVTETGQPAVFIIVEISKKWFDSLPGDLQQIVDRDGAAQSLAMAPQAMAIFDQARKGWTDGGGELIKLPPDEQSAMMATLANVGEDVSKSKPAVRDAYELMIDAAKRTR
jgi:TRAP-type C4-dicarboxylate transport system substrate-binding protein